MEYIDTFLLTLSNVKFHENMFSVSEVTCRRTTLRQTDMMKAMGVLVNGVKVHTLTSIVREGLEFIDFDLLIVYLTMFALASKDKINDKLKTDMERIFLT
jgi:hypothetical protein